MWANNPFQCDKMYFEEKVIESKVGKISWRGGSLKVWERIVKNYKKFIQIDSYLTIINRVIKSLFFNYLL